MIKIIADTLTSLPVEEAKVLKIEYLPQIIIFGEESYRDDSEIDSKTFIDKLKSSKQLPQTAAPPPALYEQSFEKVEVNNDTAIVITPSSKLSGTYRSASVAAKDFPNADIRVIESNSIGSGFGSLVKLAVELLNYGFDADKIISTVQEVDKKGKTYFLVNTLEYLQKGGRIGGASALLGSIMQVKPILTLQNGTIESYDKQRTKKKAKRRLMEIIKDQCPASDKSMFAIMHGDVFEEAQEFAESISSAMGITNIPIYDIPPAILFHAGPGVISVSFFEE